MPNWCANNLTMTSGNKSKLEEIRSVFVQKKLLDYLLPIPEGLKNQEIASLSEKEKERLEQHNVALYGSIDWYYWTNQNWGTKWDVGTEGGDESSFPIKKNRKTYSMRLEFDSAWGPPRDAIRTLANHDVEFKLTYYEGAIGFCGFISSKAQDDWDVSPETLEEIPEWIREEFDIDEHQAQLDDDEEDDDENE